MIIKFITLNGYGIFVWSSFIFTFVSCLSLYIKTRQEFFKQEKIFIEKFKQSHNLGIEIHKSKKAKKEVLSVSSI